MNIGSFVYISLGSFLIFLGFILSAFMLIRTIRDEKLPLNFISNHIFILIIIPLLFGRCSVLIMEFFSSNFSYNFYDIFYNFFLFGQNGFHADWALFGFFVAFVVLAMWKKQKHFAWLDAFVLPGLIIAIFFSLAGYFSGWGHGSPAPEWLPFPFSIDHNSQFVRYAGKLYAVQLYYFIFFVLLFLIGYFLWKKKVWQNWREGRFFYIYLFFISVGNSVLEIFKGSEAIMFFDVRISVVISILVSIFSVFCILLQENKIILNKYRKLKT